MTKSFKMVLLEACSSFDGLGQPCRCRRWRSGLADVLERRRPLLADLPAEVRSIAPERTPLVARYWRDNPVKAWTGGNRPPGTTAPFKLEGSIFALAQSVPADEWHPRWPRCCKSWWTTAWRPTRCAWSPRQQPATWCRSLPSAATPWNCRTSRT
jgi:hypothetical protein